MIAARAFVKATLRLGLRAPLVARNYNIYCSFFNSFTPGKICTLERSALQILLDEMQIVPFFTY